MGKLSAEKIRLYLDPDYPQDRLRIYAILASTNDTAKEMAVDGTPSGTAVVAGEQTAGKGRMGRSFYSPADSGVYLSMILRPELPLDRMLLLTTGVAVAACQAIEQVCGHSIQIKWVNDLFLNGKKIAGILTETAGTGYVVVGIGVNVKESAEGFPGEIAEKAGVLNIEGTHVSRERLTAGLINCIWRMSGELGEASGSYADRLLAEARKRSCILGREVHVDGHKGLTAGKVVEIDGQGFLIVEGAKGDRHTLNSGEVSLRL